MREDHTSAGRRVAQADRSARAARFARWTALPLGMFVSSLLVWQVSELNPAWSYAVGEISEEAGVTPASEQMLLCALGVKGVPRMSIEEALLTASQWLYTAERG